MTLLLEWMTPPSTHMYMIEGWYRMPKGLAYPLIEIEQKDQALDPDAQVYYFFVVGVKLPGDHQVPAWHGGLVVLGEDIRCSLVHPPLVQEMEGGHAFQKMGPPVLHLSRK